MSKIFEVTLLSKKYGNIKKEIKGKYTKRVAGELAKAKCTFSGDEKCRVLDVKEVKG